MVDPRGHNGGDFNSTLVVRSSGPVFVRGRGVRKGTQFAAVTIVYTHTVSACRIWKDSYGLAHMRLCMLFPASLIFPARPGSIASPRFSFYQTLLLP